MSLQLFMKTDHRDLYENHKAAYAGDSGIDLFFPRDVSIPPAQTVLVDLEVSCELRELSTRFQANSQTFYKNLSYYLYPRSSVYKTPIRLANSVGIIDAGYRNTLKVAVDNISDEPYVLQRGKSLFQICAPTLSEMKLVLTGDLSATNRGAGFGSSNALRE